MKLKSLKIIVVLTLIMSMLVSVTGCSNDESKSTNSDSNSANVGEDTEDKKDEEIALTMLLHGPVQYDYFTGENGISEAYKEIKPNVTIEVEKVKDTGELESTLKIRNSANELPDIMLLKPYMLANFKDALEPLNDIYAASTNIYADQYAVDGQIVGIPGSAFYEFVYYRKSIFEKYNIEIPTTWDDFISVAQLIKEKGEYIPIALGAKDAWPDYPFNEYMPLLEGGNGQQWNTMATQDEPFSPGEPFYESYKKIQSLYDANVCGDDPLGIGWDQSKAIFIAGESAMLAAGQWFATDYSVSEGDMDDLGLFLLPTRNTNDDTFYATVMADGFYSTPKDGENVEAVKEFIDWYFASDYYKEYLQFRGINPTVDGVEIDLPLYNEALQRVDAEYIVVDGGNTNFQDITNLIGFNVKKLGQEMIAGKEFDLIMSELNESWKNAREELELK